MCSYWLIPIFANQRQGIRARYAGPHIGCQRHPAYVWIRRTSSARYLRDRCHVTRADYILVTHAPIDHLMDVPSIAEKTGAQVIGNLNATNLMLANKIPPDATHHCKKRRGL